MPAFVCRQPYPNRIRLNTASKQTSTHHKSIPMDSSHEDLIAQFSGITGASPATVSLN